MSDVSRSKRAVIIGAGPAGLTAAYEFLTRSEIVPIVFEGTDAIGGISQTINYKGNRMDIGGHRFFSKSDRVMDWWLNILPMQKSAGDGDNRSISPTGGRPGASPSPAARPNPAIPIT